MDALTKLLDSKDSKIVCKSCFSDTEILERHMEYYILSDVEFEKKYRHMLFNPAFITIDGIDYPIQMNFCSNVFCKWYGLPQKRYDVKSKPSRYRLGKNQNDSIVVCNDIPSDITSGIVLGNQTQAISNYSLAEEVKRLLDINTFIEEDKAYNFHNPGCSDIFKNPFDNEEAFYKRGKSTSNSIKYQCKGCKKITNVLPDRKNSLTYNHKRNGVLLSFAKDLVGRSPVRQTCEKYKIGMYTYYNKLEFLYIKCLEFLDKNETQALNNKTFDEMFINTDSLTYNLNNIRKKGQAKAKDRTLNTVKSLGIEPQETKLLTYLIASSEMKSGYVFRADIAYDYNISLDDVEKDTQIYHCDHTYDFLRKYDRLRLSYCPQAPIANDTQSVEEYKRELYAFENRKKYVDGCHTKTSYTAMAHYWLLGKYINTKKWHFVSDDDATLENAIFRVFSDKFIDGYADYFTLQVLRNLSLADSGREYFRNRKAIRDWGKMSGYNISQSSFEDLALDWLINELKHHDFYDYKEYNGKKYPVRGKNPIEHPMPFKDEGKRLINCISDLTYMSKEDLGRLIIQLNSRSLNNFFQQLRRSICILERPFHTSRADGKSYIYSNYNPKYAQYATTILRTFYNFCWATEQDGKILTPAQRIGITEKVFDYKDIIYFGR